MVPFKVSYLTINVHTVWVNTCVLSVSLYCHYCQLHWYCATYHVSDNQSHRHTIQLTPYLTISHTDTIQLNTCLTISHTDTIQLTTCLTISHNDTILFTNHLTITVVLFDLPLSAHSLTANHTQSNCQTLFDLPLVCPPSQTANHTRSSSFPWDQ